MLNNNLIAPCDLESHYMFLFKLIDYPCYLTALCPLLFLLSDYGNTSAWMLDKVQNLKALNPQNRFLSMLAKKIKLNEMKSQVSGDCLTWPYPAGLPAMNKLLNMKHWAVNGTAVALNGIFKAESANQVTSTVVVPLAQIKTPGSFAHFFHVISLPNDILTLLSCNLGVIKAILDSDLEDQFVTKLKFKLTEMFLNSKERTYKSSECKSMLQYVYTFQNLIQQGIDCVSNFLVSYLKRWNGLDYKQEILNLCEWFVFDSKLNLINDFLKPLHELLLTAEVDDKRLYIEMYGKLYVNLLMESDKIVNKNQRRMFLSACVKCDWMREEHLSRDMFSALSTFLLQQCSMTILYSPAHRDTLLCNTLDVCLKCLTAEDYYNKPLLMMIPKCLVFLPLFSHSLRNVSLVCFILDRYKQYQTSERLYGLYEEEFNLIDGYTEDYINFLWRGTGWSDRSKGEVLTNAPEEDALRGRYSVTQLDRSLHVRSHVAIVTLAHQIMKDLGVTKADLTDEMFLDSIVQSLCPTLLSFIKTYREDEFSF
ncbi:hypothetical protein M8J76_013427 [Diaphorina citri]|nr:hypothetical protein M8J76_013427 [Diaphorina citri]KAI5755121.1 hypothetical protein M8J77_014313 [Diaphorina citri]